MFFIFFYKFSKNKSKVHKDQFYNLDIKA
jgi:hypothetical protein